MSQSRDNMQGGSPVPDSAGTSGSGGPEAAGGMDSMAGGVSQRLRDTAGQAKDIAGQAREFVNEKMSTVGEQLSQVGGQLTQGVDRIRNLESGDYEELWTDDSDRCGCWLCARHDDAYGRKSPLLICLRLALSGRQRGKDKNVYHRNRRLYRDL
jgi:hypothetical protein